jgi:hypothetical protein
MSQRFPFPEEILSCPQISDAPYFRRSHERRPLSDLARHLVPVHDAGVLVTSKLIGVTGHGDKVYGPGEPTRLDRTVIPLTPDPTSNRDMREILIEVLEQVDRGEVAGLCVVVLDRDDCVTSHKSAERRYTFAGALLMAVNEMVRPDR